MLVNFIDATTNESVAVNLSNLVCVFTVKEEGVEKTVINMLSSKLRSYYIMGVLNGTFTLGREVPSKNN
jgi:hypothetical protein